MKTYLKQTIGRGIEALTGRHKSNLLVIHDLKNSKLIEVLAMKFLVNINHSNLALSSNWSRRPAFHAGNPGSSPGRVTKWVNDGTGRHDSLRSCCSGVGVQIPFCPPLAFRKD